jgi:predicted extracellular nuclease
MINQSRSLLFLLSFILSFFSGLTQAKDFISLGSCSDTHSKHYYSIAEIQGPSYPNTFKKAFKKESWASPLLDQWVLVEGVVTLNKIKEYQGFWLQQKQPSSRQNKASHGIFIFHPSSSYKKLDIKPGQHIRLLAQVAEYHGLTELKQVKALTVCANDVPMPKARLLTLPVTSVSELEALEGMRVLVKQDSKQEFVVSDLFGAGYGLGNYGQFAVSSKLHFQSTELYKAEDIRSGNALVTDKALDYLLVDDGYSVSSPRFIPFPSSKGFSADNPLRIGDKVGQISAILHSYGDHYILIPDGPVESIQINTQPRPKQPIVSHQSNLVIASMNVENYFNGNPISIENRAVGFPTSRGAKTYLQFVMQTQKLVAALSTIDADVIALMELENDGYGEHSAIADLTRALNKTMPAEQQYRYVIPKFKQLGKDEISVGILYRSNKMIASGQPQVLDYSRKIRYQTRSSLLQKFIFRDKPFYLVVNHFKSKGRPCDSEPHTYKSAQGNCNAVRTKAARALTDFIAKKVGRSAPVLIVGDLNSYSQEDPLLVLAEAGFKNLNSVPDINLRATPIFSYSFQGYLGNLDHALANRAMLPFIRSIDSWSINSVEDFLLKYDSDYAKPDIYRSSDHDPLVIGIEFNE